MVEEKKKKTSRNYPEIVIKKLFALSNNQCAFPGCPNPIYEKADSTDEDYVLAEMAHIYPHGETGPRCDPSFPKEKLNTYENLILLCPTCHKRVDSAPFQFNVHVLRQMKADHEAKQLANRQSHVDQPFVKDEIFASAIPISELPIHVYSAETEYRYSSYPTMWEKIPNIPLSEDCLVCVLRDTRLYSFHNLKIEKNPFSEVTDPKTVKRHLADEMWRSPQDLAIYIALLNESLKKRLGSVGVKYDKDHRRYFFRAGKEAKERSVPYVSLTGRSTSRNVVWQPVTKSTGIAKNYWLHMAASLYFQHPSKETWFLSIRPERHITTDGIAPYAPEKIGPKVTKMKAQMRNLDYLNEVRFWSQFVCRNDPRLNIHFDSRRQMLSIENSLLQTSVSWMGVPNDDTSVAELQPDEDLFSWADHRSTTSDEYDEEWDDSENEDNSDADIS